MKNNKFKSDDFPNFWNLNFDEIFRAFQNEMREFMEISSSEYQDNDPITFGYSMRIGPDTQYKPEIRQWGNLNDYRRKQGLPEIELPLGKFPAPKLNSGDVADDRFVDFLDEEEYLKIIVEVPGFTKDTLNIDIDETGSEISLTGRSELRKINQIIKLPSKIEPNMTKSSMKNGVLEIRGKKKQSTTKKFNLKID